MSNQQRRTVTYGSLARRLWQYYRPYKSILFTDLAAVVILSALGLALPYLLKVMIDEAVPRHDFAEMLRISAFVAALAFAKYAVNYYSLYWGHALAARMERDMRRDFFGKLQGMSFSFFDRRKTGELMSRMTNDIGKVSDAVNHAPEDLLLAVVTVAGAYGVLFALDPLLALICLAPIPLMAFYTALLGGRILRGFERQNDAVAAINAKIENIFAGIRVVQSFAREPEEARRFGQLNEENYQAWRAVLNTLGWYFGGVDFLRDLARLVIIAAGGLFAVRGRLSAGSLVAFVTYVGICLEPIERLTRTVEAIQRLAAGLRSFFGIMDERADIADLPGARSLPARVRGELGFETVTFSYDGNRHVFRDLDLVIPAGSTVALVGPSGAGKTTFCNLIPRFYEPQSGRVTIDGVDVKEYTLASLRAAVGIVQQEVFLFDGSIRDNIAYGKHGASQADVEAAARRANAHEFILELDRGYESQVGERGVRLSGGQRQRIAIARAFLKDPPILILDEATSSLDARSERAVQEAVRRLVNGRTTLVIAHRLSTVKDADEIIVITEEGIAQRGRHDELIAVPGLYRELYDSQSGAQGGLDLALLDEDQPD
ncbi:MAG TPA: ABC transporter ATP-binding protein [Rectinemataceae bacterium]|nr:ABC transporter ATP-binding protein [Rectinemataceae bacterium]